MSRDNAVLRNDGTLEMQSASPPEKSRETENVIQISDDEDNNEGDILKCKICDLQFSTQKTLKFHMKYKHLESRLVYPCPDCLEIFSTSWSVYRHLFKVHRKTAAQIRRLRESIQAKAFKMNNPPAFYEKRKNNAKNTTPQKITEEQRLDQENQAWMDNLEGDGEVPRCGGCGRTFERRAALAAHTHTCQPRSRALARRPPDTRKIEIQIRKDYNKASSPLILPLKIADSTDKKQGIEPAPDQTKLQQEKEPVAEEKIQDKSNDNLLNKQIVDESQINKNKVIENKNIGKLPFARQTELSNFNALSKQCLPDIEMDKLQCKKCDNKFTKLADLYDHMADHYKWLRYACKLCNYKHYTFEKLPEHVKVVHKLKGDTDFYYSTVKAIDGIEALQLSECCKDSNEINDNSPESRRPSRCSSDSSRLSDDSSSSSTRVEGTRKRKMKNNKNIAKKKKEPIVIEDTDGLKDSEASNDMLEDNDSSPPLKVIEDNSSDVEEVDEKSIKKIEDTSVLTISTRRPIRKRTNKKNEDFEYDLSNLLKMEAQGYRDSQSVVTAKTLPTRKKSPVENQNNIDINKDYCGALVSLSKKAVAASLAHLKYPYYPPSESRTSNVFLRPLLPKVARVEKVSPKKDADTPSPSKVLKQSDLNPSTPEKEVKVVTITNTSQEKLKPDDDKTVPEKEVKEANSPNEVKTKSGTETSEPSITKLNVPTVVPLKLRRQSLDLIKNPLIKKNITDFSKAGMKTKILVIKPINRNKEGGKSINSPLKFQTIKLKDAMKSSTSSKEKPTDQVRVVQVPNVDCAKVPITTTSVVINDSNLSKIKPLDVDLVTSAASTSEKSPELILEKSNVIENISNINKSPSSTDTEKEPITETLTKSEENLSEDKT